VAYLHLDLGLLCGWALWRDDDRVEHGVKNLAEAGPSDGLRFYSFGLFLGEHKRRLARDGESLRGVVFERVDFRGSRTVRENGIIIGRAVNGINAEHVYGAIWGNLESWCEAQAIPCKGISVSDIKRHVTGIPSAAKPLVTERIKQLFPNCRSADEADALAVMVTARKKFGMKLDR
jgi:hypothetical protein